MNITHTSDERNLYVTITDEDARALVSWKRRTWTEVYGVADGYSETARPGHSMYERLAAIAAYHRDELPGRYVFVVGESACEGREGQVPLADLFVLCCAVGGIDGAYYIGG